MLADRKLSPHERPREIRLVAELPRTATGKLQRFLLRGLITSGAPTWPPIPAEPIPPTVRDRLQD